MMCEREECDFWAGQGCVCEWMDTKGLEVVAITHDEELDTYATYYRRKSS